MTLDFFMRNILPGIISCMSITIMYLIGEKRRYSFLVGLGNQGLAPLADLYRDLGHAADGCRDGVHVRAQLPEMDHGLITFYELIPNPRPPMRATKSAGGTLPDRHHRCEPVRVASGFGWYVFLPLDLYILFDGMEAKWSFDEEQWFALDSICYPDAQRYPPFLVMTEDHGILQIWTGLVVKTEPDWSVLVRAAGELFPADRLPDARGRDRDRPLDRTAVRQRPPAPDRQPHLLSGEPPVRPDPAGPPRGPTTAS